VKKRVCEARRTGQGRRAGMRAAHVTSRTFDTILLLVDKVCLTLFEKECNWLLIRSRFNICRSTTKTARARADGARMASRTSEAHLVQTLRCTELSVRHYLATPDLRKQAHKLAKDVWNQHGEHLQGYVDRHNRRLQLAALRVMGALATASAAIARELLHKSATMDGLKQLITSCERTHGQVVSGRPSNPHPHPHPHSHPYPHPRPHSHPHPQPKRSAGVRGRGERRGGPLRARAHRLGRPRDAHAAAQPRAQARARVSVRVRARMRVRVRVRVVGTLTLTLALERRRLVALPMRLLPQLDAEAQALAELTRPSPSPSPSPSP